MALKAKSLADWAVINTENQTELHEAIKRGYHVLFDLARNVSPLTVPDLRRLHHARYNVLLPLSEEMEPDYGPSSCDIKELTICNNIILALTNFWIYCELFHHTIHPRYWRLPNEPQPPALPATFRADWLRYCVPDVNCNADMKGQFEQLDLQYILDNMIDSFQGRNVQYGTLDEVWTRAAFHTGIPGLASLLKSRNPTTIIPEVKDVRDIADVKVREGFKLETLTDSEAEWHSLLMDIHEAWQAKRDREGTNFWQHPFDINPLDQGVAQNL